MLGWAEAIVGRETVRGAGFGFGLFFVLFFGVWVLAVVYWIVAIVEVARIPDYQFRAAGTDKVVWVLIVVLAQIIGALIWRFVKRSEVLAAAGRIPPPSPGWYADPATGVWRWWDGYRWIDPGPVLPPSDWPAQ